MTTNIPDRIADGSISITPSPGCVEVYAQQLNSGVHLDYTPEQAITLAMALIGAAGEASA